MTHKNNINDKERKDLTRVFIKLSYDIMNTLKVRSTKSCITSSISTNKDAFLISTMHEHNFNVWGSNLMTWPEFTWLNPNFLRALHLMCHISAYIESLKRMIHPHVIMTIHIKFKPNKTLKNAWLYWWKNGINREIKDQPVEWPFND